MGKDKLNYPDFIIVGGTKCGSTSIWLNCDKHPVINMVSRGFSYEMKFWKHTNWSKGFDWYCNLFEGKDGLLGEKCAGYYARKNSMIAIANYIPDVKIILSMRHPVDRMYSHYQMNLKSNKVRGSFSQNFKSYKGPSFYYKLISQHILPYYRKDQVHYVIMERMKNDTTKEMNKIFSFLGLNHLDYPVKDVERLLKGKEFLEVNRNEKFYRRWSTQRCMEDQTFRSDLMKIFSQDILQLKELLNDDIPEWGV